MSTPEFKYNFLKTIKLASDINSCGFNAFNTLAIGTSDKTVSVWEWTEEGFKEANYSPLLYHDYAVTSVIFSPDGLVLATSSMDGMTYLFNSKTGGVRASIVQSIGGGVRESAIASSDHRLLGTVTDEGYVFLWNLDSYQIQRYWLGHEACIACLGFSPDSYLLATGDTDGTYKLWLVDRAVSSLYMVDTLCGHVHKDAHDGAILTLAFSPNHYTELVTRDYQMCSGGDDNVLRLWEASVEVQGAKERKPPKISVKFLKALEGHLSSVTCARYSPDGRYIGSTSLDSSARIWEVSSGVCVRVLGGHRHSVFCCAFSPELAFFASGSNDKTVNVWQLTSKPVPVSVLLPSQIEEDVEEKAMERRYFTIFDDIKLGCNVNSVDFNNNFDLIVGCSDKMVRPFVRRGSEYKEKYSKPMIGHNYSVVNVEVSRCGRYLVTGSIDGSVIVWNYATGEMINRPFQLSSQGGRAARFSPASDWLALGGSDGKAYLWSIKTQAITFSYPGHIESINCVAFSPDGEYLATGCTAGQVKLWKANPAVTLCQLLLENVHDLGVMSCDFSNVFTKMKGTSRRVYRLATGGNDSLVKVFKLWPVDELVVKAEEMFCMRGHGGSITEVRFSGKSSDVLASTAIDRTARIWNMQNGQCLNVLTHHKSQVTCCAFSPDSTLFATGSLDSSVIVWKVPKVICLNNKYETVELNPHRVVNPGESLDLNALRIDDVQLSLDDLVTAAKRNSVEIPDHFLCPITQQLMTEPVICEDGFTYENHAIQAWMVNGRNTSPMTNVPLSSTVVVPNAALQTVHSCYFYFALLTDGFTYENHAIQAWMVNGRNTSPMTNMPLSSTVVVPNAALQTVHSCYFYFALLTDGFTYENHAIQAWMVNGRNTSPMTNVPLSSTVVVPNAALQTVHSCYFYFALLTDGFTYENHAIQAWMVNGRNTSPMTNVPLSSTVVVPNAALQTVHSCYFYFALLTDGFTYENHAIQAWMVNGRNTSPMTNVPLSSTVVVPNAALQTVHSCYFYFVLLTDGFTYENHAIQAWMVNGRNTSPMTNVPLSCTVVVPNAALQTVHSCYFYFALLTDGFTYENHAIQAWMVNGRNTSPMTNVPLSSTVVVPNAALQTVHSCYFYFALLTDGFTYENHAIQAWMVNGRNTSPMTNVPLSSTVVVPNAALQTVHSCYFYFVLLTDGFTYENLAIQAWMVNGRNTSPMTNVPLSSTVVVPNAALQTVHSCYFYFALLTDGFTYENHAIQAWMVNGRNTSPMTNVPLSCTVVVPNAALQTVHSCYFYFALLTDGFTYENHAIQAWMVNGRNTSPMTNVPLSSTVVVPNAALQTEIKKFLVSRYDGDGLSQEASEIT